MIARTELPRPGSADWWRARAARPRRASTLTAERIVTAAIELLDADGLEALTMRRLGDALDSTSGSLYRHFESREAVLVAVHDQVLGESLDFDPPGDTWVERIANLARAQRALLLARPYLAEIWRTSEQLGPNALRARERALRLTMEGGFPPAVAARAYLTLLHFTIGFATLEHSFAFRTPETRRATEQLFLSLPADEYPAIRTLASHLTSARLDEEFELGLESLIGGFLVLADRSVAA